MKKKGTGLAAAGVLFAGIMVATLGYGFGNVTSQAIPIWQKVGTVVSTFPSTLTVSVGTFNTSGVASFNGLVTTGGATSTASTTEASMTLATSDVCDYTVLPIEPTVGSITLTFPTATELAADCIPTQGNERKFKIHNASTTGTAVITLADGTGGVHLEGEGLTTLIDNNEWAFITLQNIYGGAGYILDVEIRQDAD